MAVKSSDMGAPCHGLNGCSIGCGRRPRRAAGRRAVRRSGGPRARPGGADASSVGRWAPSTGSRTSTPSDPGRSWSDWTLRTLERRIGHRRLPLADGQGVTAQGARPGCAPLVRDRADARRPDPPGRHRHPPPDARRGSPGLGARAARDRAAPDQRRAPAASSTRPQVCSPDGRPRRTGRRSACCPTWTPREPPTPTLLRRRW